jgi:hypothetical protein
MAVVPAEAEDSPSINYYFTLTNNNVLFPLENLGLAIVNCDLQLEMKNSLGQDVHTQIKTAGQEQKCDFSKSAYLAAERWQKHRLRAGEPYTFILSD